jgi:predicted metal-binding protein
MVKTYELVNSIESLSAAVKKIRCAQSTYAAYTQEIGVMVCGYCGGYAIYKLLFSPV